MKKIIVMSSQDGVSHLAQIFNTTHKTLFFENYDREVFRSFDGTVDCFFLDLLNLQTHVIGFTTELEALFENTIRPTLILLTQKKHLNVAVDYLKYGFDGFLTYPINQEETRNLIETIQQKHQKDSEITYLRNRLLESDSKDVLITHSVEMNKVFKNIESVGPTRSTVLLSGETGVGKTLLAKQIHQLSKRAAGPFIALHCGAIADSLIESELFGHEKGSFTGAIKRKLGRFELATGGTIFLDEIGTISKQVQIKLLQVLQDGVYQRVGGETSLTTNVRIIAATNENLSGKVERGEFRRDLFYRLNVFPITIPPLRSRLEDLPHLVTIFLEKLNSTHLKSIEGIDSEAMDALINYDWPGNIRELENIIERAYILESSSLLTKESLPLELTSTLGRITIPDQLTSLETARRKVIEEFEKEYIATHLRNKKGSILNAASSLDISTRQLHNLMKKYHLNKKTFK